jgi:hypothetical protein
MWLWHLLLFRGDGLVMDRVASRGAKYGQFGVQLTEVRLGCRDRRRNGAIDDFRRKASYGHWNVTGNELSAARHAPGTCNFLVSWQANDSPLRFDLA